MVEDDDDDKGETTLSTEEPNVNHGDGDDDGADVEDNGLQHCQLDPWKTNFLMDRVSQTLNEIHSSN